MSFIGLLCAFGLGLLAGAAGGIVLGFAWYERKCGLMTDQSGKRAAAIRAELDDVMDRRLPERRRSTINRAPEQGFHGTPASERIRT